MLTILVVLILSATILVVLLLVIVVVGIRQEPATEELSEQASSFVAVFVRRLLALHVHKPNSQPTLADADEMSCLARDPCLQTQCTGRIQMSASRPCWTGEHVKTICIGNPSRSEPLGPNAPEPSCRGR